MRFIISDYSMCFNFLRFSCVTGSPATEWCEPLAEDLNTAVDPDVRKSASSLAEGRRFSSGTLVTSPNPEINITKGSPLCVKQHYITSVQLFLPLVRCCLRIHCILVAMDLPGLCLTTTNKSPLLYTTMYYLSCVTFDSRNIS